MPSLAAARRWCDVTRTDYVPALLERGRERAAAERLEIEFREADAEALPFADGSFDAVVSTFGVMFTPDQERAAAELAARVQAAAARSAWRTGRPTASSASCSRRSASTSRRRPASESPALWGTRARIDELFERHAGAIRTAQRHFVFRYRSPEHWLDVFRTYYGPVLKAFAALDAAGQAALEGEIVRLIARFNRSGDGTMVVPSEYLEVVVTRD